MRTVYIDTEKKCHVVNDGNMTALETDYFDGKCDAFIEGHCCSVNENSIIIWPWKSYNKLDTAQREYERELLRQYENDLAELDAALLEVQYQNLTEDL